MAKGKLDRNARMTMEKGIKIRSSSFFPPFFFVLLCVCVFVHFFSLGIVWNCCLKGMLDMWINSSPSKHTKSIWENSNPCEFSHRSNLFIHTWRNVASMHQKRLLVILSPCATDQCLSSIFIYRVNIVNVIFSITLNESATESLHSWRLIHNYFWTENWPWNDEQKISICPSTAWLIHMKSVFMWPTVDG